MSPDLREPSPTLVERERDLASAAERLSRHAEVAIDIESNGLFAYKASLCIIQLAAESEVVVVDALTTPLAPLAPLLASDRVVKIVHDVAFDARILAEAHLVLANVHDTSLAARMLGRMATGLASLLSSELSISLDKKMQHHDWGARPLDRAALAYLAGDVVHLPALAAKLFTEVEARGIGAEVEEETRYRLAQAAASVEAPDERPPYVRLKGIERAPADDLPFLRRLAELRERRARELDVPPYKVLAPDVLFAIARARPKSMADLEKIRGATQGRRARSLSTEVLRALETAAADGAIPSADRAWLSKPRAPSSVARARRAREQALTKWRRDEAKKRSVDEQVVLPGHVVQALADVDEPSIEAIARIPGLGAFRVARDGQAILAALGLTAATPGDA